MVGMCSECLKLRIEPPPKLLLPTTTATSTNCYHYLLLLGRCLLLSNAYDISGSSQFRVAEQWIAHFFAPLVTFWSPSRFPWFLGNEIVTPLKSWEHGGNYRRKRQPEPSRNFIICLQRCLYPDVFNEHEYVKRFAANFYRVAFLLRVTRVVVQTARTEYKWEYYKQLITKLSPVLKTSD